MTIDEARQQLSPNDWHRSTASSQGDWLLALFCDSLIDRGSANSGRVGPPLRHHKRGCPTLRAFRRVGTTDLTKSLPRARPATTRRNQKWELRDPRQRRQMETGNWKPEPES